ncbi:MAG: zinc ribbon domain-containing protein [Acidobacteriaceae bacterium]|nr:zinc ribbon domain-containing protein [Acidobacteriaceae bacterium]MBV9296396.1 zinc ribbon domain-containing protein [Acidobacteriaceae bacterium]
MPLYEYRCDNCGERFEVIQKFSDPPLERHDKCGGVVHRLISAPALQFKGSGWYVTDYARAGSSAEKSEGSAQKTEAAGDNGASKKKDAPAAATSGSDSSSTAAPSSGSSSEKKSSSPESK